MEKVKIGIIGTGYIGNVHARIYARDERAEVAALYDAAPEKAAKTAKSVGGKVCASREELFEHCDAVLICTPNKTHTEIASDAVKNAGTFFAKNRFPSGCQTRKNHWRLPGAATKFFRSDTIAATRRFMRNSKNCWAATLHIRRISK